MNDYNFGNFVCMLREKKGLTQADIAERLGVTAAAVSKWENGSSKPRVEILFKLAEILGVRPEELMAGHYMEEKLDTDETKQNTYSFMVPRPSKKAVIAIVCAMLSFILILTVSIIAIVFAALGSRKSTEEYKLAYAYLIESQKFEELGLNEDNIHLNSYSKSSTTNADGDKVTTVEIGFQIGAGRSIYVICHDDGEGWYVCTECTKLEVILYLPPESAKHFDILRTAAFAEEYAQEEERTPPQDDIV